MTNKNNKLLISVNNLSFKYNRNEKNKNSQNEIVYNTKLNNNTNSVYTNNGK